MDYISGKFHIFLFDLLFRFDLYEKKEKEKEKEKEKNKGVCVGWVWVCGWVFGKNVGGLVDDIILYHTMPMYLERN